MSSYQVGLEQPDESVGHWCCGVHWVSLTRSLLEQGDEVVGLDNLNGYDPIKLDRLEVLQTRARIL